MKCIVVANQKGGAGKTTTTASLSVRASKDGPTYIIDTDPQGTLSTWHGKRAADEPARVDLAFDQIPRGLATLKKQGAAFVFVDTPPTHTEATDKLLKLADLVLIPTRPSPLDLWAAGQTVARVKAEKIPFLFVVNDTKPNTVLTAQAAAALSHHGRVSRVFIGSRTAYAGAMVDGRTATELQPKSAAAQEVDALWQSVLECLHG